MSPPQRSIGLGVPGRLEEAISSDQELVAEVMGVKRVRNESHEAPGPAGQCLGRSGQGAECSFFLTAIEMMF